MTINDIAILAKVSTGTVDRVIHNRGGVSKKTEKIINNLIKKNNFEINSVASALAKTKEYKIATLMPIFDDDDMFWESPFLGVEKASSEIKDFGFKIINYSYSQTNFKTYLDSFNKLIDDKPNGIILVPAFNNKTKEIFEKLNKNITPENIQKEIEYFDDEHNKNYERTYGWAWLLKLAEEIHTWDTETARELEKNLQPLTDLIVQKYIEFLPKLNYPIRVGEHPNTAFGLTFAWDYANTVGHQPLKKMISTKEPSNFKNLYAPGFNRIYLNNMGIGFNYTISYLIPIIRKNN